MKMGTRGDRLIERKGSMRGRIEKIEEEMKKLVIEKVRERKEGIKLDSKKKEEKGRETEELRESLKKIEWRLKKKREGKKRNIIIKGIKEGRGEWKEEVANLLKGIGVEITIGEEKRIGTRGKNKAGMALIKIIWISKKR